MLCKGHQEEDWTENTWENQRRQRTTQGRNEDMTDNTVRELEDTVWAETDSRWNDRPCLNARSNIQTIAVDDSRKNCPRTSFMS